MKRHNNSINSDPKKLSSAFFGPVMAGVSVKSYLSIGIR